MNLYHCTTTNFGKPTSHFQMFFFRSKFLAKVNPSIVERIATQKTGSSNDNFYDGGAKLKIGGFLGNRRGHTTIGPIQKYELSSKILIQVPERHIKSVATKKTVCNKEKLDAGECTLESSGQKKGKNTRRALITFPKLNVSLQYSDTF